MIYLADQQPPTEARVVKTTLVGSETICTAFSKPATSDQATLDIGVEDSSLLLDDLVLDLVLKGDLDKPVMEGLTSPVLSTENGTLLLDNDLLNDFTDLDCLLDPAWTGSTTLPSPSSLPLSLPSPSSQPLFVPSPSGKPQPLSLPSPFSEPTSSEFDIFEEELAADATSPLTSSLASSPSNDCLPNRKRSLCQDDCELTQQPPSKMPKDIKYHERRQKNNLASKVSRAKRRTRHAALFEREKALEEENALLRVKVEEMTKECEKLRKLVVGRLVK